MMKLFRERLIEAMNLRDMNQKELSKASGISKESINQYVKGVYTPKPENLFKIANALRVNTHWLSGKDVPKEIEFDESNLEAIKEECSLAKIIQEKYGLDAVRSISYYLESNPKDRERLDKLLADYQKLDGEDKQAVYWRVFQMIEDMLAQDKYSAKKESKNA